MGQVWKAHDTRLQRLVAIKQLKGGPTGRFQQEARAIAALNHPHVCQIFDIGPDYLVLEFVEGAPLRGPLPPEAAIGLALQIAGALEAAHRRGILHRDLKPANVIVTETGAKVLDFGLAKLTGEAAAAVTETAAGAIVGTPAYMSPEQVEGKPLDARSDIFSFGALLYELISGRPAFARNSVPATLYAVMHAEPEPLDAPPALQRTVARCLAKDPGARFATMTGVRAALTDLSAPVPAPEAPPPPQPPPSIAVLPFVNMSRDPDDDYFSDGLAEEILNLLARIPGLNVTARTSSFAFRGKEQDIGRIARALRVRAVLEGSVRRAGNRIRVNVQLIDAADGYRIWSERYDREMTGVFEVQDEIGAAIAEALKLKLAPAACRAYQPKLPAYEAFLKGRYYILKTTPDGFARGKQYLEEAIALDPAYAAPHAELAICYVFFAFNGIRPPREVAPLVREEARRALDLDPNDARALNACCAVASFFDYDWKAADRHFRAMLASDSVLPELRARGSMYALAPLGRFEEEFEQFRIVLEQDPLNVIFRSLFAVALTRAGQYERALEEARKADEIDPSFWMTRLNESTALWALGRLDEARASAELAVARAPWHRPAAGHLAALLELHGDFDRAREILARPGVARGFAGVHYHAVRGDPASALECYAEAIEAREPFAVMFAAAAYLGPIRQHPRWPAVAQAMNLPGD
jgi:serine/threonine-protein kinase